MDYEKLFEHAKDYIDREVIPGTEFEVKSLFEGIEWEKLGKGTRTGFGRYFSNAVKNQRIKNVIKIEQAQNNHSRYKKLDGDTK